METPVRKRQAIPGPPEAHTTFPATAMPDSRLAGADSLNSRSATAPRVGDATNSAVSARARPVAPQPYLPCWSVIGFGSDHLQLSIDRDWVQRAGPAPPLAVVLSCLITTVPDGLGSILSPRPNSIACTLSDHVIEVDGFRGTTGGPVITPPCNLLSSDRITVVRDWPASQCALARIRPGDPPLAERFELYLGHHELANGYHELTDAAEQRERFERDLRLRESRVASLPSLDERLLGALAQGMPACAGVALGVDRLLMAMMGSERIAHVLAYEFRDA